MSHQPTVYFFGTEHFAESILSALLAFDFLEIKGVVTRPDAPTGRKQILTAPPVKILAEKYGLKIFQPAKLADFSFEEKVDLAITAEYGAIIPGRILKETQLGFLNVHTSLLPKYRGASPVETAIKNGEKETGVTLMLMDEGLDTGGMIASKKIEIKEDETAPELKARLATLAIELLGEYLPDFLSGRLPITAQDHTSSSKAPLIKRDDGLINWKKSAEEIYNLYRAYSGWPGIYTIVDGRRLKILKVSKYPTDQTPADLNPGEFRVIDKKIVLVGTPKGALQILALQWEGKNPLFADSVANHISSFEKLTADDQSSYVA